MFGILLCLYFPSLPDHFKIYFILCPTPFYSDVILSFPDYFYFSHIVFGLPSANILFEYFALQKSYYLTSFGYLLEEALVLSPRRWESQQASLLPSYQEVRRQGSISVLLQDCRFEALLQNRYQSIKS